jgi:phosphomannomutase
MTLIKSISGIRGTIGGVVKDNLTPLDVVSFASAYGSWLKESSKKDSLVVVIGRDARLSGEMVSQLASSSLRGLGIDVVDLGLSTTPTVELAVPMEEADGGIILTASHNPKEWNALKLLNEKGEFISAAEGKRILDLAEAAEFQYAEVDDLGSYSRNDSYLQKHIQHILGLDLVDVEAIKKRNYRVVVDGVNSTGGTFVPELLKAIGVNQVVELYCEPNGNFPHNPEPLAENLSKISAVVKEEKADLGIVVDPDVDRLALVDENGEMFGEEYTLVAVADYVLKHQKGATVSNLSSTRALRDVTEAAGQQYFASAVGEVNVVTKMKEVGATIGGEGNGGVIYPTSHYGRDALVGIALFLSHLATLKEGSLTTSQLRQTYNDYTISKNKISLTPEINVDLLLEKMQEKYKSQPHSTVDGLKIEFDQEWVHLRKSNTEPIIRVYSESQSKEKANQLAFKIMEEIKSFI